MSGRTTSRRAARFDVKPTQIASEDLSSLRGDVRRAAKRARLALASSGCQAASYRLSGIALERICVVVLPRNFRMLVAFPSEQQVVVLLVGPHGDLTPQADVYSRLYELLGVDVPDAARVKPECCEDGVPPVDPDLVERLIDRSQELARGRRRARRRA